MKIAELGRDVRLARERAGLSQDGLAYLAGVSRRTVIRVEQGRWCSLRTALKLLRTLEGEGSPVTALSHYADRQR